MKKSISPRSCKPLAHLLFTCLLLLGCGLFSLARAANGAPVLITRPTSTRAVALESPSLRAEPFSLSATIPFGTDARTRIMVFALNLDLLVGEGANAFSADVEDSSRKIYPLKVEYVGPVPGFEGVTGIIVRLSDQLAAVNNGDVGDVLLRVNLHGVASNRVRIAIGHVGGGPADDAGSVPTPAPTTPPTATPASTPNPYTDPALAAGDDGVRFLEQATWGPTAADLTHLRTIGFRAYLNEQFNLPASTYPALGLVPNDTNTGCPQTDATQRNICLRDNYSMYPLQRRFFVNALYGPDQLRQRTAFALHKILVVSGRDIFVTSWMTPYLRIFDQNAFGNFRQLLYDITLNPAMGNYLDMASSRRTNPNENYAREILQLFSIGLDELNPDGTPKLDAQGNRIPTYDQTTITNFARVFTGWTIPVASAGTQDYINPMIVSNENNHDTGQKVLLRGQVLPPNQSSAQDLNAAIDNIFNHPNVGPFISKQLIQNLVTSNPSPAYVERVAAVFNNNGAGVRGDLRAVVTAILLDPEARGDVKTDPNYGHLREPVLFITNILRAFNARSADGTTTSDGYLAPRSTEMDQDLFRPPTVFSYFPADNGVPGSNLSGPEFGILSTATSLKRANFVNQIVFNGIPRTTDLAQTSPQGTALDLTALQALAADPQQLVDALNTRISPSVVPLMHGTMTTAMRSSIISAVQSIPTTDPQYQLKRARTAVYLVATSSQYQVER
jgi:uncharacterized protein (DUF1800 family)